MSTTALPLREAIRTTLAHRDEGAPHEGTIARTTVHTLRQVAARLAPVIGAGGVDALLKRSQKLTSATFPWLAMAAPDGNGTALVTSLEARLVDHETDTAAEAGYALLVTFIELLASLIGEPLTERLLHTVWAPASTASVEERTK